MDKEAFEQQESVQYWMDSLPGKDGVHTTKYMWKIRLRKFCNWAGKTPDELIAERKEEIKSEDGKIQHRKEMLLKRYLKYLEEERGLAPNSRRVYFTAVRNFFQRNYLPLTFMRREGPPVARVLEGSRAANKDDIRKMCDVSKPRRKAIILFIKDCGLAEADVVRLKLKDLGVESFEEFAKLKPPIPIILNRKKTGAATITFLGPEAHGALKTTFEIRMRGSPEIKIRRYGRDEIKGGIPPEKIVDESPLFRSYGKFLRTLKEKERIDHLTPHAISVLIRKAAITAGVWRRGFSAHALRRFFQTTLEATGISQNWIKIMMGHKLPGVEGSYSRPTVEMLREAYKTAMPALSISEVTEQRTRIEMLEMQVQDLLLNGQRKEAEIRKLRNNLTKTATLEKRIEHLEQLLREIHERKGG